MKLLYTMFLVDWIFGKSFNSCLEMSLIFIAILTLIAFMNFSGKILIFTYNPSAFKARKTEHLHVVSTVLHQLYCIFITKEHDYIVSKFYWTFLKQKNNFFRNKNQPNIYLYCTHSSSNQRKIIHVSTILISISKMKKAKE